MERGIYHGRWDSPEADQSYKRFITTLLENPALPLRDAKTGEVLVSELVRPDTVASLREVRALPKGEPGTFDNPPRQDVSFDVVRQTLPFMPPVLRTMVMLQLQTGMRPSEVYRMTAGDIDRTRNNGLWYYIPKSHKTEKYIGQKPIPLGKPK